MKKLAGHSQINPAFARPLHIYHLTVIREFEPAIFVIMIIHLVLGKALHATPQTAYQTGNCDYEVCENILITRGTSTAKVLRSEQQASGYSYAYLKLDEVCWTKVEGSGSSLPVEWLGFEGEEQEENSLLTWQTSTEYNASHFEVEFSQDGGYFQSIGQVSAVGNTQEVSDYSFLDRGVGLRFSGVVYYRLRQVDRDGKFSYSKSISIELSKKFLSEATMNIYPNPASRVTRISFGEEIAVSQVRVLNTVGEEMKIKVASTNDGLSIHLGELMPGYYITQILTQSGQKMTETLVVAN